MSGKPMIHPLHSGVSAKRALLSGISLAVATGLFASWSTPADSQSSASSSTGDVIVTARRVEERLQDVPVAVTALSQQQIDNLVVHSQADLLKIAPGLQLGQCNSGQVAGGGSCPLSIRGFSNTLALGNSSVVTYFGDVPDFPVGTFDLQNIQVLKGPQGTLFGDTTTGGALLYTPKKPSGKAGGFIEAEVGNYNEIRTTGAYENSLFDDAVMFRVAGQYREREGFTKARFTYKPGVDEVDDVGELQLRASLVVKPWKNFENYTIVAYNRFADHGGGTYPLYTDPRFFSAALQAFGPTATPTSAAQWEFFTGAPAPAGSYFDIARRAISDQLARGTDEVLLAQDQSNIRKQWGMVNQTRIDFGEHLYVRNIFSVRGPQLNDFNFPDYYRGDARNFDGVPGPFLDRVGLRGPNAKNNYDDNYWTLTEAWAYRQVTNELQVVGDMFDERLQWQAGWFYKPQKDRVWYAQQTPQLNILGFQLVDLETLAGPGTCAFLGAPPATPCHQVFKQEKDSEAYYTQGTFALTDNFKVTGGIRRTRVSQLNTETTLAPTTYIPYTASNGVTVSMPILIGGVGPFPGAPIVKTSSIGSQSTTYNVGIDWKPTDDILLYIAHRKGFKPGGENTTVAIGNQFRVFGPESIKDAEIGAKADWEFNGVRARTNFAAYKNWYTDIQVNGLQPGVASLLTFNGGEASTFGFELEQFLDVTPWFEISGNVSYTDTSWDERLERTTCAGNPWRSDVVGQCFGLAATTPITTDYAKGILTISPTGGPDRVFNFSPAKFAQSPWTWAIQPTVKLEPFLGEDISISANIYGRAEETGTRDGFATYAGVPPYCVANIESANFCGDDQSTQPGYTLVDLAANWRAIRGSNFSAWVRATNVTDERFRYSGTSINATRVQGTALSEPRMIMAGMRYDF